MIPADSAVIDDNVCLNLLSHALPCLLKRPNENAPQAQRETAFHYRRDTVSNQDIYHCMSMGYEA